LRGSKSEVFGTYSDIVSHYFRYSELEREAPEFVEPRPAAAWPNAGAITVEKLEIRYAVSHLQSTWIPV
jgi:hypothetical protein